jgi:hypothetical protein
MSDNISIFETTKFEGGNNYGVWNVKIFQLLRHGGFWVLGCPNNPMVVMIDFRRIIAITILIVILHEEELKI